MLGMLAMFNGTLGTDTVYECESIDIITFDTHKLVHTCTCTRTCTCTCNLNGQYRHNQSRLSTGHGIDMESENYWLIYAAATIIHVHVCPYHVVYFFSQ